MWSSQEAPGPVAASEPTNKPPVGTLYAVIVGIDRFPNIERDQPAARLANAVADAQLFSKTLSDHVGDLYAKVVPTLLVAPGETDRAHIVDALERMQRVVGPRDAFVFYAATHGAVADGDYVLVTSDAGPYEATIRNEAIDKRLLTQLIANIRTTQKAIFLDTCYSGAAVDGDPGLFSTRGRDPKDAAVILSRQIGLDMLMAANSEELANEGFNGHGLFTYVLAQGLAGEAAANSEVVRTNSLATYVEAQVPAQPLPRGRVQHATHEPGGSPVALAKVRR